MEENNLDNNNNNINNDNIENNNVDLLNSSYYGEDKEIDEDTPLNKSLKQLSIQSNSNKKNKKILYTLWFVDPEWIDTQSDNTNDDDSNIKENLSFKKLLFKKFLSYSTTIIKLPYSLPLVLYRNIGQQTTRQSNFSPLHIHNQNQATSKLLSSYDGSILASTQNTEITFRSSNDNFSTIQKTCNFFQNDKESQWQRLCFSPDNTLLAFSSSGCKIYIFLIEKEQLLHMLSPGMFGLNPKDGIADLAIRHSKCNLDPDQKCYELLILGYDMILRRFHIPTVNNNFTIHSFISDSEQLPNSNNTSNNTGSGSGKDNSSSGSSKDGSDINSSSSNGSGSNKKDSDDEDENNEDEKETSSSSKEKKFKIGFGCSPSGLTIPNFKQVHHSVSCMHFSPENNILAIGGNRKSKKSSNRGSRLKAYVSFWKISDTEPYFTLLNIPSTTTNNSNNNNSVPSTSSAATNLNTSAIGPGEEDESNNNENYENLTKTQKIWKKLKFTLFGNYFKTVVLTKVVFSTDGKQLISLDLNGTISLWNVPKDITANDDENNDDDVILECLEPPAVCNYKPIKIWTSRDLRSVWNNSEVPSFMQQYSNQGSSSSSSSASTSSSTSTTTPASTINQNIIENLKIVIDISWWSDNQIIVGNKGGQFTIFSMIDNENCLLHDPELVSSAQPLILTNAHNGRFFILETSYTSPNSSSSPNSINGINGIGRHSSSLSSKSLSEIYQTRIKLPMYHTYKYLLRYFNGGDITDDQDDDNPFQFNIQRDDNNNSSNRNRSNHNNNNNNNNQQSLSKQQLQKQQQQLQKQKNNENNDNIVYLIRRIIRFQSTTPEQLFKTKVSQKEYGNALLIAEHYGLDKDLVHQKRWTRSMVSSDSIKQYLDKVLDTNWVLWSCQIRIPLKLDATRLLLEYALEKTNILLGIGNDNGKSTMSFDKLKEHQSIIIHRNIIINYLNRLKTYQEIYQNDFDASEFLRFRDCSLVSAAMEYASLEDFKAVSILFSYYGDQILPYRLDILSMIPETTLPETFKQLLPDEYNIWNQKKSLVINQDDDWCQSREIFENVLSLDWNQRMNSSYLKRALNSLIGKEYEDIRSSKDLNLLLDIDIYSIDYNDGSSVDGNGSDGGDYNNQLYFSFQKSNLLTKTKTGAGSSSLIIQEWYKKRAMEIDRKSGQIINSLSLINIAIVEKHVCNLLDIQRDLEELNSIIYSSNGSVSGSTSSEDYCEISLSAYQSLDPLNKIKLLLNDCDERNCYQIVKSRCTKILKLHPYLLVEFFENYSKEKSDLSLVRSFLQSYIKDKYQQLQQQQSLSNSSNSGIGSSGDSLNISNLSLLKIGLNCIYNIQSNLSLKVMNQMVDILEILPERGGWQDSRNSSNHHYELEKLFDLKIQYTQFVSAMKILNKYQLNKPISYFIDKKQQQQQQQSTTTGTTTSDETIISIMTQIFKYAKRNNFKQSSWRAAFEDCLSIKRLSFSNTDDVQLYWLFVKNLLSESLFFLANEYLPNCGTQERIESLVLCASKEFFNSSSSYGHTKNLEEARSCLELIKPPTRKILAEINLIKAIDILYSTFNFNKLPVEVRLILEKSLNSSGNNEIVKQQQQQQQQSDQQSSFDYYCKQGRFEIISILLSNCKDSYLNIEIILQISELLSDWVPSVIDGSNVNGNVSPTTGSGNGVNDKIIVLILLGKFSMNIAKDYKVSYNICKRLITEKEKSPSNIPNSFQEIWKLCSELALLSDFTNINEKIYLLSFSLVYCDADNILILLKSFQNLQLLLNINIVNDNDSNGKNQNLLNEIEKLELQQQQSQEIILNPPFIEQQNESICKLFKDGSSGSGNNEEHEEYHSREVIDQLLLYYYQINNSSDSNGDGNNNDNNNDKIKKLLVELSKISIENGNMKSCLSCLLYLNNDEQDIEIVDGFFKNLINSNNNESSTSSYQSSLERCIKLACYFYSLKYLLLLSPSIQLFSISIETTIRNAINKIKQDGNGEDNGGDSGNEIIKSKIKSLLSNYYNLMVDSIQEKELASIDNDYVVDFNRFKQDENYKIDTIYNFAKSNQIKSLDTSISMAKRYGVSIDKVLLKHIEWQLLENKSTSNLIISNQLIIDLLNTSDGEIKTQLNSFYNEINGLNYEKLLYWFDLISLVNGSSGSGNGDQQQQFKKEKKLLSFLIKSNAQLNGIDFKLVQQSSYDPISEEIKSQINPTNLSFWSKLISILQEIRDDEIIHNLSLEKIYYFMVENLIESDFENVFSIFLKYKSQLDDWDLQQLYISFLVGHYSTRLSIQIRIKFIILKLNELKIKQQQINHEQEQQGCNDGNDNYEDRKSNELLYYQNEIILYQSIEEHLISIKQLDSINSLIGGNDFIKHYDSEISSKLLNYFNDHHHQSGSGHSQGQTDTSIMVEPIKLIGNEKEKHVESILSKLIKSSSSTPTVIKSIYNNFYPPQKSQISTAGSKKVVSILNINPVNLKLIDYYLNCIDQLLNQLNSGGDGKEDKEEESSSIIKSIESICKLSIQDESLDDWDNTLKLSILKHIREYKSYKSIEIHIELVEMLLKQIPSMYDDQQPLQQQWKSLDQQFIKQHKTQSIIKDIWKDTGIDPSIFKQHVEITDPLSCVPMFNQLLDHSNTIQYLLQLSKLLILWNKVGSHHDDNDNNEVMDEQLDENQDNLIVESILSNCWFKLFEKIVVNLSVGSSKEIINSLLSIRMDQVSNKFSLSIDQEKSLLALLKESEFTITTSFKFSLLSNYNSIKQIGIDNIKNEIKSSDSNNTNIIELILKDQQLVHLVYTFGAINQFVGIAPKLYKSLFDMLLQFNLNNRNKIDKNSVYTSCQYTVAMLCIDKQFYHASLISLFWWRIDFAPLATLENSLVFLEKFLSQSITLINQQKLTDHSIDWLICKDKIQSALNILLNNTK